MFTFQTPGRASYIRSWNLVMKLFMPYQTVFIFSLYILKTYVVFEVHLCNQIQADRETSVTLVSYLYFKALNWCKELFQKELGRSYLRKKQGSTWICDGKPTSCRLMKCRNIRKQRTSSPNHFSSLCYQCQHTSRSLPVATQV